MYAKLIKHSITVEGKNIYTFELDYPRIVHAEMLTHRELSRNAASSRAIPIDKLIGLIEESLAYPSAWGLNEKGMQANSDHGNAPTCMWAWEQAAKRAVTSARQLQGLGLHKQICNRVLEAFQNIKVIVTATELDNWFWLRDHKDADPTIAELAGLMKAEVDKSTPFLLYPGEYHLPYIVTYRCPEYDTIFYSLDDEDCTDLELEDAIKISTSCCAQVSYRLLDDSVKKALMIYSALVESEPVHASPFEHVATPMMHPTWESLGIEVTSMFDPTAMEPGEHLDSNGNFWSGNFKGWYQYRQSIPNNSR